MFHICQWRNVDLKLFYCKLSVLHQRGSNSAATSFGVLQCSFNLGCKFSLVAVLMSWHKNCVCN